MTTLQAVKEYSQINDEELHEITKIMFDSFVIHGSYKSSSFVSKKEIMISLFTDLIEQYLKLNFSGSRDRKLQLINFISKLNMQKELLELASKEANLEDIQIAAERLGRKSQSAFESK